MLLSKRGTSCPSGEEFRLVNYLEAVGCAGKLRMHAYAPLCGSLTFYGHPCISIPSVPRHPVYQFIPVQQSPSTETRPSKGSEKSLYYPFFLRCSDLKYALLYAMALSAMRYCMRYIHFLRILRGVELLKFLLHPPFRLLAPPRNNHVTILGQYTTKVLFILMCFKNLRFLEQQRDLIIKPNVFRLPGSINKMRDIQTFLRNSY